MTRRPTHARDTLRGWALAGASAALAVGAHGLAGGGTPDTALAVMLTVIVAWAGTSVAGRHKGPFAVLMALGTAQLAMHLVLNFVMPEHPGHVGHMAHHAPALAPGAMWATHITATLLTALLLAKADAALRVIASTIRGLLPPPVFQAVTPGAYALPALPTHLSHMLQVVLRKVHARRGPPVRS
ncbi:hypothetical protein GCM10029964_123770 [Kibdelosporangium lantanae]